MIGRCCIAAGAWATVESTPLLFKAAIKDPRTLCGKHSGYVERRRAGHAGVFSVIYADLLSVRCVWYYLHEAGSTRRLFMMYASHRVHSYVTNIFVNGCSLVEHLMQTASWFFCASTLVKPNAVPLVRLLTYRGKRRTYYANI